MGGALPFLVAVFLLSEGPSKSGANERDDTFTGNHRMIGSIGAVVDQGSRLGREQKTAMEMVVHDFNLSGCSNIALHITGI